MRAFYTTFFCFLRAWSLPAANRLVADRRCPWPLLFRRSSGAGDRADLQERPREARCDFSRMDAEVCDVIITRGGGDLSWRVLVDGWRASRHGESDWVALCLRVFSDRQVWGVHLNCVSAVTGCAVYLTTEDDWALSCDGVNSLGSGVRVDSLICLGSGLKSVSFCKSLLVSVLSSAPAGSSRE